MALPFYNWSLTAASNATADSTVNWSEGQAPSSVNDSGRAMMASIAAYRDDTCGAGFVTGGTSTAYTLATSQVFSSLTTLQHAKLIFVAHATNGASPTLNVDGLGAKAIVSASGVAIPSGTMIANSVYAVTYVNGDTEFRLHGIYGNPYNIPLGGSIDYWGATVPNNTFVFPIGQAISRSTYSALFSLFGTTYGVGDASTTFNIPDLTGRTTAMKEASATRLTASYFAGNSTTLGAVGGGESSTLLTANLPAYTPAGTITNGAITINSSPGQAFGSGGAASISGGAAASFTAQTLTASQDASTFAGAAQGGSSTPVRTVPPTIICNKILRII